MPNNIAVSVTADVADLTAKMAIARAEVRTTSKALNDLAREFQGKEMTADMQAQLLAAGDAAAKAQNNYALLQQQMRELTATARATSDELKATADATAVPPAAVSAPNTQSIINSSTGVSSDTKSAAESAAVFEAAMGIQTQRAKELRDAMAATAVATDGTRIATSEAATAAMVAAPNFLSIINATTGVSRASKSAAESATVFEAAMGVQALRAKELRDAMATATTATAGAKMATAEVAGAAAAATPNFLSIINATTGVGRSTKSAAESASVFEEALGVQAKRARELREAMGATEHGMVSSRAATEGLVLVHEALSGRYNKMTGSAMILTQALAGQEAVTAAVNFAMSATGAVVLGTAAALTVATIAAVRYNAAQTQLTVTALGLGAASGLTASQLKEAGEAAAVYSNMSNHASVEAAEAFAGAGIRSSAVIMELTEDLKGYSVLTGQKVPDGLKNLSTAMHDPIKAAADLNDQLSILDRTQLEEIQTLTAQGDKTGAVAIITQALSERLGEAQKAGIQFNTSASETVQDLQNLFEWFGKATAAAANYAVTLSQGYLWEEDTSKYTEAAQKRLQHQAQLKMDSSAGTAAYNLTPEGQDAARQKQLRDGLVAAYTSLKANTELHGAHSKAADQDRQSLIDYQRALQTFIPAAEKAHKIAAFDAQIAQARQNHDKQRVADLTRQREEVNTAGQLMSPDAAKEKANDAANLAQDRLHPAKHADETVARWAEELHQQEIASGEFFKDQTAKELAFWTEKLALTTAGSKDWLQVQARIYEAAKTLAHQDYQDHLAALNERIQADRNNWAQTQADWQEKLAYIKGKYGEEGAEYKNAAREWLHLQQQHNEQDFKEDQQHAQRAVEALKKNLDLQAKIREDDARAKETLIRNNAGNTPYGDVSAQIQIGQIEAQLMQQKIADLNTYEARKDAQLQDAINKAKAAFGEEAEAYKSAVQAKTEADEQFKAQHQQLDAQQRLQSIQSILAVQQAYHGYVDGLVSSSVSGFDGVISGQKTWAQMGIGLYGTMVRSFEQQLEKMVSNWIVQHLFMTAAQRAQLAEQSAQHAASEGVKTTSTMTGSAMRATAENTGFFAKLAALLGIHVAAHTAGEVTKTTATISGATARTSAEITAQGAALAATRPIVLAQAMSLVGLAGAGGVASMAAAPFPFDLGAPAFGASMAASAAGFATMASFDKGVDVLPADMIAQVHAGERIIPAADNKAIMDAVGANGRRSTGEMHLHYAPQLNADTPSFQQQLRNHASDVHAMVQAGFRSGALKYG